MKKEIYITLFSLVLFYNIQAQNRLNGSVNFDMNSCPYSKVDWEVDYNIRLDNEEGGIIRIYFNNLHSSVDGAKYQLDNNQYLPSDLGLSSWPDASVVNAITYASYNIYYKGIYISSHNHSLITNGQAWAIGKFWYDNDKDELVMKVGSFKLSKKDLNIEGFSITLTNSEGGCINPSVDILSKLVSQKNNSNNNSPSSISEINSNSGSGSNSSGSSSQGTNNYPSSTKNNSSSTNTTNQPLTQKQLDDDFKQRQDANRAKYDAAIATPSNDKLTSFNKDIDQITTSFYAMQSINDKRFAVEKNMSLNGNYKSVEELEQDFTDKYNSLQQSLNELHKAEQNQNLSTIGYYSTVGGNLGTAGTAVAGGLYLLNELQNQKEKENALKELERQKAEAQRQINKAKIASRNALREDLFAMFPEGGIALSQHKINVSEIYFFLYSFDESTIQTTNPTIQLSNVFPIAKYSDETWPYRSGLNNDFSKLNLSGKMTLVGFYTTEKMAHDMRNSFVKLAGLSEMNILEVVYKGKPKTNTTTTNSGNGAQDFWGESVKKTPSTQSIPETTNQKQSEDDFWGVPVKTIPTNQIIPTTEPIQKTTKLDYWGNPIKE
jgi:hypothetical protein